MRIYLMPIPPVLLRSRGASHEDPFLVPKNDLFLYPLREGLEQSLGSLNGGRSTAMHPPQPPPPPPPNPHPPPLSRRPISLWERATRKGLSTFSSFPFPSSRRSPLRVPPTFRPKALSFSPRRRLRRLRSARPRSSSPPLVLSSFKDQRFEETHSRLPRLSVLFLLSLCSDRLRSARPLSLAPPLAVVCLFLNKGEFQTE